MPSTQGVALGCPALAPSGRWLYYQINVSIALRFMTANNDLYGLAAEFEHPHELLQAACHVRAAGYTRVGAYTPIPVEGLYEALGHRSTRLPYLTLLGAVLGGVAGFGMQYYAAVISYPMNIGGRPLNSWQSFMPIVFELSVLGAALFSVLGMLALNGLPQPYHPLFNLPEFRFASRDRFFLCIQQRDPKFDPASTRRFLEGLHAHKVLDVPW
jgi:hypothetical protein